MQSSAPKDDSPPASCCALYCEQGSETIKKQGLFGTNYSQHVLYTPFNELDWWRGHWLRLLARPVIQDEPCNLPHVTSLSLGPGPPPHPIPCYGSTGAETKRRSSNTTAPVASRYASEGGAGEEEEEEDVEEDDGREGGRGGEPGARSHNYNN